MTYSKREIEMAVNIGKEKGASHTLIVCDTFDHSDYPVHVMPNEDIHEAIHRYSSNMQNIMEVYNHAMPVEEQLSVRRAYNI